MSHLGMSKNNQSNCTEIKGLLQYREMHIEEAERIAEIDATCYIKNVWRMNVETGQYELTEINWTDKDLPNGFEWHLQRFKETFKSGGKKKEAF